MPTDPKGEKGLREAAKALLGMRQPITTDVGSAHSLRGNGASEWMREDDREMRKELREAFDRLEVALARAPSALTEAAKGAREAVGEMDHALEAASHYEGCVNGVSRAALARWRDALKALAEVEGERS